MIRVSIIGTGNVAWHLTRHLAGSDLVQLIQVVGRDDRKLAEFEKYAACTSQVSALEAVDILLLAVSDSAIATVAKTLVTTKALVVHTSGSMPLNVLAPISRRAVCYLLQTFTKGQPVPFQNIPVCMEVHHASDRKLLETLAKALSSKNLWLQSPQRKHLHLSAVFVNNFVNHLLASAEKICDQNRLSFELLKPLAEETVRKAFLIGPKNSQTGPARRDDHKSIQEHLNILEEDQTILYKELTNSILRNYGRKKL